MLDSGGLDCVREVGGALWEQQRREEEGSRHPLSDPATPSRGLWRAGPAPLTSLLEISLLSPVASTVAWDHTENALCFGPLGFLGQLLANYCLCCAVYEGLTKIQV